MSLCQPCSSRSQSPACSFPEKCGAQRDDELICPAKRFSSLSVETEHCNSSFLLLLFLT